MAGDVRGVTFEELWPAFPFLFASVMAGGAVWDFLSYRRRAEEAGEPISWSLAAVAAWLGGVKALFVLVLGGLWLVIALCRLLRRWAAAGVQRVTGN